MDFTLETERLILWPLNIDELELLLRSKWDFDEKYHCTYRGDALEGFMADIFAGQLKMMKAAPEDYLMLTFWMLLRRSDRVILGSADFKAPPTDGQVEIGYGLTADFEGQGYMSEAVEAMCRWAFARGDVTSIIAETETWNDRSQNLLKRCGFTLEREKETYWWRRNG